MDYWNDHTPDVLAPKDYTPAWLRWVLNHQEEVVVLLVLLAFAAATNGSVSVGGGSGA